MGPLPEYDASLCVIPACALVALLLRNYPHSFTFPIKANRPNHSLLSLFLTLLTRNGSAALAIWTIDFCLVSFFF